MEQIRATPGFNHTVAIDKLEEMRTAADQLKTNPCTGKLHERLTQGMNQGIEQVGGFIADTGASSQEKLAGMMESLFIQLSAEAARLFKCLPNC